MTGCQEDVPFCWKPNPALEQARAWIESKKTVDDDDIGVQPIDTHFFREYDEPKVMISKAISKLEEKKIMLSAVLELCGFTRDDSSTAVRTLIEDLKFYSQDNWIYFDDSSITPSTVPVEFTNGVYDITLIGRILGPAMRLGRKMAFSRTDKTSEPFWHYLVDLLSDFAPVLFYRYPLELTYDPPGMNFMCGGEFVPTGERTKYATPMIIFENADLFSAVKTVIESVWQFNGKTYWTPTHVFVQESQFDLFIRLLKLDAVNYVQMLGIDTESSPSGAGSVPNPAKSLPVLQPCDCSHFKFLLGWDPKVLDSGDDGVVVLPFRTVDEGVSMANALANSFCASVWTEKLKFNSVIAPLLKVNTIWVNCHGVLDHHTSFGRESKFVPTNGPDLFELLLATTMPKKIPEVSDKHLPEVVPLKEFVKTNAEALKAVKSPFPLKDHERVKLLKPLQQQISVLDPTVNYVWPSEFEYRVTEAGVEITSRLLPSEPLVINMLSITPTAVTGLLVLVHLILTRGSGVVIRMPSSLFLDTLQQHLALHALCSKGFVVFVVNEGSLIESSLVKDDRAIVLFEGKSSSKAGMDFPVVNYPTLLHLSHIFSNKKNVLVF